MTNPLELTEKEAEVLTASLKAVNAKDVVTEMGEDPSGITDTKTIEGILEELYQKLSSLGEYPHVEKADGLKQGEVELGEVEMNMIKASLNYLSSAELSRAYTKEAAAYMAHSQAREIANGIIDSV